MIKSFSFCDSFLKHCEFEFELIRRDKFLLIFEFIQLSL